MNEEREEQGEEARQKEESAGRRRRRRGRLKHKELVVGKSLRQNDNMTLARTGHLFEI